MDAPLKDKFSENVYKHMRNTCLFSKMRYIPKNICEMFEFITFHHGSKLFDDKIRQACNNVNMSALQLDTLFMFARHCQSRLSNFQLFVTQVLKDNFSIFKNAPTEFLQIINFDKFINLFSDTISEEILFDAKFDRINNIAETFNSVSKSLWNNPFSKKTIKDYNILTKIIETYFVANPDILSQYVITVNKIIRDDLTKILKMGNDLLSLCLMAEIDDATKSELSKLVDDGVKSIVDFDKDELLDVYYEYYYESYCEDNNLKAPNIFAENSFLATREATINKVLAGIAMKAHVPKLGFTHNIIDCFIEHNLISDKQEGAMLIYNILLCEKDSVGYTNKFDTITLEDHFTLIAIANDMNITYAQEMEKILKNKSISIEFPAEIILRILGRVFNIIFTLYSHKLSMVEIDNTIIPNSKMISLYNYSVDDYYNIYPFGTSFVPVNTTQLTINNTSNKYIDVVEV